MGTISPQGCHPPVPTPCAAPRRPVRDDMPVDREDELPSEPVEPSDEGARIRTADGWVIVVRTDRTTGLASLSLEDSEGVLVESRVLGMDDLQLLLDALNSAREQARTSDVPVVLDVSAVIGRD